MIPQRSKPLLYLITDRRTLPRRAEGGPAGALLDLLRRAFAAGVDMAQLRERDLPARDLCGLAAPAAEWAREAGATLLINDRADVAASLRAGVHLTTRSLEPAVIRGVFGAAMPVGVSTHSLEEARAAERGGADFVVFGPVFDTPSKRAYGPPVGLGALRDAAAALRIPVLALGGIRRDNFRAALDAGAAGIAAISLFAEAADLVELVREVKAHRR